MTKIKKPLGPKLDLEIISKKSLSPSSPLKTKEKAVAPIRIMKTMEVSMSVSLVTAPSIFLFSFPLKAVRIKAPIAPIPAASVGEAIPPIIVPNTSMTNSKGNKKD